MNIKKTNKKLFFYTFQVGGDNLVLGHSVEWAKELKQYFESMTIIAFNADRSKISETFFGPGTEIVDLGIRKSRLMAIINFYVFFIMNFSKFRQGFHFVHMAHYMCLLLFPLVFFNKNIVLWYAHKNVGMTLRIATKLVKKIYSSNKLSFRLKTEKVSFIGHGIPINKIPVKLKLEIPENSIKMVIHGRFSAVKQVHIAIQFAKKLSAEFSEVKLDIIGVPITEEDKKYVNWVKQFYKDQDQMINFRGGVPYSELIRMLKDYDVALNFSQTGSLDKSILESLAAGVPVVSTNESAAELSSSCLGLIYVSSIEELSDKKLFLEKCFKYGQEQIRESIEINHSLKATCQKIFQGLSC